METEAAQGIADDRRSLGCASSGSGLAAAVAEVSFLPGRKGGEKRSVEEASMVLPLQLPLPQPIDEVIDGFGFLVY